MSSFSFELPTILEGWLPPNRANWELIAWSWQFFPIITGIQWLTSFYPQGKTSIKSRFNINGHLAWFLMEIPGMLCAWYCVLTIPPQLPGLSTSHTNALSFEPPTTDTLLDIPRTWSDHGGAVVPPAMRTWDIPVGNKTLLGMYTVHYIYRAIVCPLVNPSMSPIHPLVFVFALLWQTMNGLSIGGWIAGYGKSSVLEWAGRPMACAIGLVIWGWALIGNIFHDDELREIRREVARRQRKEIEQKHKEAEKENDPAKKKAETQRKAVNVSKAYMMPQNALFNYILYPHYLCEWIEWGGFWLVGGWDFMPGRVFLVNEIATMLPRAVGGWHWYVQNFGMKEVGKKKAIIPFLL